MKKKENMIAAVISILLGFMLIIMKNHIISLAITVIGVAVLVSAVVSFINKLTNIGIMKAVVGVCILVFGWMFINLALYILAASIIVMGLLQINDIRRFVLVDFTLKDKILLYTKPGVTVLAGICLLFNQGGTIAWVFILTGILLVAEGVLELISLLKPNH